ncbi:MAG TPA: beta-hexosaminidase [bacterium]|nr:beta-hexosaminidase [bacterium]
MRHWNLLSGLLLIISAVSAGPASCKDLDLMPWPERIEMKDGRFYLDEHFQISLDGFPSERLARAATRILRRLGGRTGLFFPQDLVRVESEETGSCVVACVRAGELKLHEDESYTLRIDERSISITAETDIGCIRAMETLLQLLGADTSGYFFPVIVIEDRPRFPWRGLLIDVCRHFMPLEVLYRNIDAMAAVKMNVLHLHLTEDQGFRVEYKGDPRLHEQGSDGFYYTHEQIRHIVEYAADRGIRVLPEFDMPGHVTSWLVGVPELGSQPGPYSISRVWGVQDPCLDPTQEFTYEFLEKFLAEMAGLFPDEYVHIGGDEINGNHWNANPQIVEFMKNRGMKDHHELQHHFNERVLEILTRLGKKMVGWDEIFHPELSPTIVIQSWRGREAMIEAVRLGYQTFLSNGYYIDLIQSVDFHYQNDPIPPDSPLTDEEKRFILGGEATMWAEFVSPETIDSRIWPRTAAIAERFWSSGTVRDLEKMHRRLKTVSFRLEELGLLHIRNRPMMLRRLTHNQDIEALNVLVEAVEPLKGYQRGTQRQYTSHSPLTRLVDAAGPDAPAAREFRKLTDAYLSKASHDAVLAGRLTEWLTLWKGNHGRLKPVIRQAPVLKEVESLSRDLSVLAEIGLEALKRMRSDEDDRWIARQETVLQAAKAPRGGLELMVVDSVEKLVRASGRKERRK